jgi:hypothetical protein
MKPLQTARYVTLFFIGLTIIIILVRLTEKKLNLNTFETLVLILLFCIAIGIHYTVVFMDDIESTGITNTLDDISQKGILGSLVK